MHDAAKLIEAVQRTYEVDETGDANLVDFLTEPETLTRLHSDTTLTEVLEWYLVWANGEEWDPWIWTAEVGSVPPGKDK